MKFQTFFCVALLFNLGYSANLQSNSGLYAKIDSKLESLKGTKFGSLIANMAQLHLETSGPLEELISAVEQLSKDLQDQLVKENADYGKITEVYEAEKGKLKAKIAELEVLISTTDNTLQNTLYPKNEDLKQAIKLGKVHIEMNRAALERATKKRAAEKADYDTKTAEHKEALTTLAECTKEISSLSNSPSFIQINRAKMMIKNVEKKLNKSPSIYAPLIEALVELGSAENFADQKTVKRILELLEKITNNVKASQADMTEQETQSISDHNDFLEKNDASYKRLTQKLEDDKADLVENEKEIKEKEALVKKSTVALNKTKGVLEVVEKDFEDDTQAHETKVADIKRDQGVIAGAVDLVKQYYPDVFSEKKPLGEAEYNALTYGSVFGKKQ